MEFLQSSILSIYPMMCVFLPCIVYWGIKSRNAGKRLKTPLSFKIWRLLFILYLYLVIDVTGIGTIWDIGKFGSVIRLDEIAWMPFQFVGIRSYILNIIMFIPLGFLLPFIWKRYRKAHRTFLTGAGFSLTIEIAQLFNRRATDIDDLISNTLGAIIGYLLWCVFNLLFSRKPKDLDYMGEREPVKFMALSIIGTFLLYNWRFFVRIFFT